MRLTVDFAGVRAFLDEKDLGLTLREWRLLNYFLREAGRAVTREEILRAVWHETWVSERNVDTQVKALRTKLGEMRGWIFSVYAYGYRWDGPSIEDTLQGQVRERGPLSLSA